MFMFEQNCPSEIKREKWELDHAYIKTQFIIKQ